MLETKNIEKIKALRAAAQTLRGTYPKYIEKIKDSSCDKHQLSFKNGDSRFTAWKCEVSLTAYTGYYGNSSCSTFGSVDNALVKDALNAFLDSRMKELLEYMAVHIDAQANAIADKARKEIANLQALIDNTDRGEA